MEIEQSYVDAVYNNFLAVSKHLSNIIPQSIADETKDSIIEEKGDFEVHNKQFIITLAVSYYEKQLMRVLKDYIGKTNDTIAKYLALRAIDRGYTNLLNLNRKNAKTLNEEDSYKEIYDFFGNLGGKKYRAYCEKEINDDENLQEAIKYFFIINRLRNKIVHGEYENSIVKNLPRIEAIHEWFTKSKYFINWLPKVLDDYKKSQEISLPTTIREYKPLPSAIT